MAFLSRFYMWKTGPWRLSQVLHGTELLESGNSIMSKTLSSFSLVGNAGHASSLYLRKWMKESGVGE